MSKYIDADKLIAEIERRKKQDITFRERNILVDIEVYIASFQQEQPEVDLEKEIEACWLKWLSPSNQKEVEGVLPKTEFDFYARHFYELGLNAGKED